MTEENYKKILNKYSVLKEHQKKIHKAKEKLHNLVDEKVELEKDAKVQEYLQVMSAIRETKMVASTKEETDEDFFDTITNQFYGEEETNRIYVYIESYIESSEFDDVDISTEYKKIQKDSNIKDGWNMYEDIKKPYLVAFITVPRLETKKFEEENIVLFAPKGLDSQEFYELVRRTFFKYAIEFGQEEAVQKIVEEFGNAEQIVKRKRSKKQTESITKLV